MTVHHARAIALAAVLVGISAPGPSSALGVKSTTVVEQQSTATNVFDKNSPAIVTIQTPSGFGSGVLVDPSGVIVTNLHVVELGAAPHARQREPDLSQLSAAQRTMVSGACGYEQRSQGPAAYYRCLNNELVRLLANATPDSLLVEVPVDQFVPLWP